MIFANPCVIAQELNRTCRQMQQRIMELLGEVANEEVTSECSLLFPLVFVPVSLFLSLPSYAWNNYMHASADLSCTSWESELYYTFFKQMIWDLTHKNELCVQYYFRKCTSLYVTVEQSRLWSRIMSMLLALKEVLNMSLHEWSW